MGYCIMRNEKIKTMSHCIGLENEHNRASSEADLYKERFSPNIDWEKTDQNIYLVRKNNWKRIIDIELRKHNIKKRKDAVLLIDSIYTASPEVIATWDKETMLNYFKDCLEFHQKHYGLVINAVIHLDETTPHLHVDDIPLIQKEDGSWKLSAKEVIGNRSKMSKTQSDFYKEVGKKYGLERGEEKSLKVHKEVSHKLAEDNKKLKAENSGLEERNNQLGEEISSKEEFGKFLDSENQSKDNILKNKEAEIQKSKELSEHTKVLEQKERELKQRISELQLQAEFSEKERNSKNDDLQQLTKDFDNELSIYKDRRIPKYKKNLHGMYLVPEEDILFYENLGSHIRSYERLKNEAEKNYVPTMKRNERLEREVGRLESQLNSEKSEREREKQQTFEDVGKGLDLSPQEVRKAFEKGRYDRLAEENPWKDISLTLPKSGKLTDKQKIWIEKMLESQLKDGKVEHNWMIVASREVGKENFIQKMKQEIIKSIEIQEDSCAKVDKAYRKHASKIASKFYGNGNVFSTLWNLQNQVELESDYGR